MTVRALGAAALVLLLSGCSANWGWYVVSPATDKGVSNLQFLIGG
ncbi:MAG: amino acid ABC transporter permease, partial [Alphaproteobacteria bacterium HGW-Alphaproteobacteria-8]